MPESENFSLQERETIQVALKERVKNFFAISSISNVFRTIWGDVYEEEAHFEDHDDVDPSELDELLVSEDAEEILDDEIDLDLDFDTVSESDEEPEDWMIGLTTEFIKSIKKVDKKLKGRILDALGWLSKDPVTMKGNTVKPLTDELAGLWRYRVGNYRLIYKPDDKSKRVTLLTFSPRGDAY